MRGVLQRVSQAQVSVEGTITGRIQQGVCVLVGVGREDSETDARWLAEKCVAARLFTDQNDKMNLSVKDIGGKILAVSQFTLYGDLRSGRRPSFTAAMEPARAKVLFDLFCDEVRRLGVDVETGVFRAHMDVSLCNSGPVTLLVDSSRLF